MTPAMQAGLTDHVWSLAELLETALAAPEWAPPDAPRRAAVLGAEPPRVFVSGGRIFRVIEGGRQGAK